MNEPVKLIAQIISDRKEVGFVVIVSLGLLVLAGSPIGASLSPTMKLSVAAVGILGIAAGMTTEMLIYLQASKMADRTLREANEKLVHALAKLETRVNEYTAQAIPTVLTQDDVDNVKATLTKKLTSEAIKAMVSELRSDAASSQIRLAIRRFQNRSDDRLTQEIADLGRRANLNLVIGFFISFIGLSLLSYFVYTTNTELDNPQLNFAAMAIRVLIRFSLVVIVEVFAYFFLRLYRYSLFEIKYFQNELTNIEMKNIALTTAILSGDKDTTAKLALELVKTERNFVLKKGEITLALRKDEMENSHDLAALDRVEKLFEKLNAGDRAK